MRGSSGAAPGLLGLPPGGGGVSPLGDRFQPDLIRGSGSFSVPIHLPAGPAQMRPQLSLNYGTGSGNGPFGLGWRLDLPRIERRSDRGLPAYDDSDSFVLGGAEVLVDVGGGRFRPRVDTQNWLIERDGEGWRIRTGSGSTMRLGVTANGREAADGRVFAWAIESETDPAGNETTFDYELTGGRLLVKAVRWSVFTLAFVYEARPDVVRNGRAGFLRTLERRVAAIELRSARATPALLRTYKLDYREAANGLSLLSRVALGAQRGGETATVPPLELAYSDQDLTRGRWQTLTAPLPPPSLAGEDTHLVDMTGDGLPDILHDSGGALRLWHNMGGGHFEGPTGLPALPAGLRLRNENVAFADLNGNGRADLFVADRPVQLAVQADGRGGFDEQPIVFAQAPSIALASPRTRLADMDGDGVTDLLATALDHLVVHRHVPGAGWADALAIDRLHDLDLFPDVNFGDLGVRLADMTGDGLQDIVLIRSGDASYWPNLGGGRFGARVELAPAPLFPAHYQDERVFLVDVDGDGCADLVYCGGDETTIWLNRCGSGFRPAVAVPVALARSGEALMPADIFGEGMVSLVWAERSPTLESAGCIAYRFAEGPRPYLLTSIDNGMGGTTRITYANSTEMRMADRAEGRLWSGSLPMPVPLVASIEERDEICGGVRRSEIRYRDGVYDGVEREFRGFGEVDQILFGDESTPTLRQRYHYYQGDPEQLDPRERQRQRALAGSLMDVSIHALSEGQERLYLSSTQVWEAPLAHEGPDGFVFTPRLLSVEQREKGKTDADRIDRTEYSEHDAFGNVGRRRRVWSYEGQASSAIISDERWQFVAPGPAWLVKLTAREQIASAAGVERVRETYYDGVPFEGLALGKAERGVSTRTRELHMADAALPPGYLAGRDPALDGFSRETPGAEPGWYATTFRVRRDARGNIVEQLDALGHATLTQYDADGLFPIRQTDPAGHVVDYVFDPVSCEPARISASDGRVTRYACDPLGRPAAQHELDDEGEEQLVALWRASSDQLPAATLTWIPRVAGLTPASTVLAENAADVEFMTVLFNGFGERIQEIADGPTAAGGDATFVSRREGRFNVRGKPSASFADRFVPAVALSLSPAATAEERIRYDANGHVVERAGPGAALFRYERDTASVIHFEGGEGTLARARTETFDAAGRVVRIDEFIEPGVSAVTLYELTFDGRVARVLDGQGKERIAYSYDASGEPIRIESASAGVRDYHRDAAERVISLKLADGKRLDYEYDSIGRPVAIRQSGAALREFEYGAPTPQTPDFTAGRLVAVREPACQIDYGYTRLGRTRRERLTVDGGSFTTAWEYDHRGSIEAIVHPDGVRVEQEVDRGGRVRGIPGFVAEVDYNADDTVAGYRLENGVRVETSRDGGRITALEVSRGATRLRRIDYQRDPIGSCVRVRDETPSGVRISHFSYDGARRLAASRVALSDGAGAPVSTTGYLYDAIGNIRAFGETGSTFDYGDAARPERLTSVDSGGTKLVLGYDERGHATDLPDGTRLDFDLFDRLVRAERSGATTIDYVLDPLGRVARTIVSEGEGTRTKICVGSLFERHGGFDLRHIYLDGRVVATVRATPGEADRIAFSISDHQGTALLQVDAAGAAIAQQRYTPFGAALHADAALDRYLGIEREPIAGLQRMGSRIYAAQFGRFLSPDWYILENPNRAVGTPQGFNLYSYSINNPVDLKDPSGRWFFVVLAVVAAVGFVVGFASGVARGKSFGESLLIGLETALTTTIGAALGAATGAIGGAVIGFMVGGPGGALAGFAGGAIAGGIMGGINGLYTGSRQIYDWEGGTGFAAFFADSTWGLLGTSIGNLLNIYNSFAAPGSYQEKYSKRQNRQVYDKGFNFSGSAFTQGNVISHMDGRYPGSGSQLLAHETAHILQNRLFGPIYTVTYAAWFLVVGLIAGSVASLFYEQSWGKTVRDWGYSNNPWERWSYHVGGNDGKAGEAKW